MMTMQTTESSLDCPICANRFTVDGPLQPRTLKCGHTFCTNCIQQISKTEKNLIKCSFCSSITPVGVLGIYALPVNRKLVDILLRQQPSKMMEDLESYLRRLQDAQNKMETIQDELGATKTETMQKILDKFIKYQHIFQEQEQTLITNLGIEVSGIYYMYVHIYYIMHYYTYVCTYVYVLQIVATALVCCKY